MVTGVIDRQHFFGVIRVGQALVEVDHPVEGAARADPIVDGLVFFPFLNRPIVAGKN